MKTFSAVLNQIKGVFYRLCLLKIILSSSSEDRSAVADYSCLKCMSKRYLRYPLHITTQSRHTCIHTKTTAHVRAYVHIHAYIKHNTTNTNTLGFS